MSAMPENRTFQVVCRSARRVNEITGHDDVKPATTPTFFGRIGELSVEAHPGPGWYIQLCAGEEKVQWCIDTGAQVSITPKQVYQSSFGELLETDRVLIGAGDTQLNTGIRQYGICSQRKSQSKCTMSRVRQSYY